ncbi:MAG: discoidin domain-containing protein [Candidatus Pristimantibacillus lignocellulolyticus]|uniref:Discoidin domain-containing protein n=1 Tax=Candidatus Pristimantibacillus lignocellulolyticus TaxID=2994561 RepID=A0A9J6ZG44_9BACL|nr:MAG: discoidin domain-containing protein [Candidatus Pristimantibacillus lignocellulolyticus]
MTRRRKILSIVTALAVTTSLFTIQPDVTQAAVTPISVSGANDTVFGPNVYVFDPTMNNTKIQEDVTAVFNQQESNEFGNERYALLFKPGTYNDVNVKVGFYTQVAGLGQNPDDVHVNTLNTDAKWDNGNATRNFWRGVENLSYGKPTDDAFFAVSQAAPMRRVHAKSKALLLFDFDPWWNAGWASGGYIADSKIDGNIVPGSQQQFFSRNNDYRKWDGSLWNMVLVGDKNPQPNTFPSPAITTIEKAPVIKEKPYLYTDGTDYKVFVPSLQKDRKGVSWENGSTPGTSRDVASDFYIAQPGVTASTINAQLNNGKSLIFTPGIYHFDDTINVTKPNTVVLGLGLATIEEDTGKVAMKVADVEGVVISGLMFEASLIKSTTLLEVGSQKNTVDHSANPILLSDLFFRVGGTDAGTTDVCLTINSNNVIGDHFWIWRADHGEGAGWDSNISKNGLVVNGDDVTIYGLFNEHHEEYQTLWNGNGGRVYFYQSEIPYDPPSQDRYMSHDGTVNGYAAYKVADHVTTHEAWGLGVYANFTDGPVKLHNAIEVPKVEGVILHSLTTVFLSGIPGSGITHIVNDTGESLYSHSPMTRTMTTYTSGDTQAPTTPENVIATAISGSQIDLTWDASTDNSGVDAYDIYRNGKKIGSTSLTQYSDSGLSAEKQYTYTIIARDSFGNQSTSSNPVSATTTKLWTEISKYGWSVLASHNNGENNVNSAKIIDGNSSNIWESGTGMIEGMNFIVDMNEPRSFGRVVFQSAGTDYARGYAVSVSDDGTNWGTPVATGTDANAVINAGSGATFTVDLNPVTARYVKVELTVPFTSNWWKINEFSVYTDKEKPLNRDGWEAITELGSADANKLIDGNMATRWSAGTPMIPGQSIVIDMKNEQNFNKILMDSTGSNNDYARSYEIYVSNDGENWGTPIVNNTATGPVILSDFADQNARFIKIVQMGTNSGWWSIYEISVFRDATNPVDVSTISVNGTGGADVITTKGGTLQMQSHVLPAYADETSVSWSVYNVDDSTTDKATINQDGLLTAVENGKVKVIATSIDGSNVQGVKEITISGQNLVTSIEVSGLEGLTSISTKSGTLNMSAEVLPDDADNSSITWSVVNEDGTVTDKATISADGVLTAVKDGNVKVIATANDGTGITGELIISITGQISSGCQTNCGGTITPSPTPTNNHQKTISAADLNNVQGGNSVVTLGEGKTEAVIPVNLAQQVSKPVEVKSNGISVIIPTAVVKDLTGKLQGDTNGSNVIVRVSADPKGDFVYTLDLILRDKDGKETKLSTFPEPITLVIHYDDTKLDSDLIGVYYYNEALKEWEYIGGKIDKSKHNISADVTHFSKYGVREFDKVFTDVPTTHWAYHALKVLSAKHIVSGVSATEFNPSGITTRAEFVAMLTNALGLQASKVNEQFTDVNSSDWFAKDVAAAYDAGLIRGVTDTTFAPDSTITREEIAILMVRAYEYVKGKQTSIENHLTVLHDHGQISSWASAEVNSAIELGLMKGKSTSIFAPQASATRAETAQVIFNLLNALEVD